MKKRCSSKYNHEEEEEEEEEEASGGGGGGGGGGEGNEQGTLPVCTQYVLLHCNTVKISKTFIIKCITSSCYKVQHQHSRQLCPLSLFLSPSQRASEEEERIGDEEDIVPPSRKGSLNDDIQCVVYYIHTLHEIQDVEVSCFK